MSTNVLPALPGLEFPWTRSSRFQTRKQQAISGKEIRIADWSVPRYTWGLSYSALRQGTILGSFSEFYTLLSFFETLKGGYDSFLYTDPDDNAVTGQAIGSTDGVTRVFSLLRTLPGGVPMPILAPNLTQPFNLYVNGVLQSGSSYTVTQWGTTDPNGPGQIEFGGTPGGSAPITADFSYYFPVRFDDDTMNFEKFMAAIYQLKKMSFTSIK